MRLLTTNPLTAYLAFAVFLTGVAMPAIAIENGKPDPDNAYQNVGALGVYLETPLGTGPFGLCSGFVISDRAFVTAAHCLAAIPPLQHVPEAWAVTLEPGSPKKPILPPGTFTTFEDLVKFAISAKTESPMMIHFHPRFVPQQCNPDVCEYDVAVLEFPAGTFKVPPVRLARFGLLRSLKRLGILKRLPIGVVGYGAKKSKEVAPGILEYMIPGHRRRGFTSLAKITRTGLIFEPTPILDSKLSTGDSGSPQFVLGRVVSLSSFGADQRLDIPAVQHFLAPYIRRY